MPKKKCREPIFNEFGMGYNCELELYHLGPCMSWSSMPSRNAREAWEKANPGKKDSVHSQDTILD